MYNDQGDEAYRQIAAWYRTAGDEQMLVIHNFGGSAIQFPLTDDTSRPVAVSGEVEQCVVDGETSLRLGGYASVVFKVQ